MSPTTPPKVSVVLTTYKRAAVLPKTLDSILAQTLGDFELIVSDDCSPDDTEAVVRGYERRDPRVRYRRNATNLRMPGNLNAGVAEARGEYVANLHDGDVYRADLLEKWSAALDRHPGAAFVFNELFTRTEGGDVFFKVAMPECLGGREFLRRVFVPQWGSPVFGTVMARRSCYEAVGPFDARFGFHSDVEMWVRLASRYDVAYVAEPLIEVTPREASGHLMAPYFWEEVARDIRIRRLAMGYVYPPGDPAYWWYEVRLRARYARLTLPQLLHRRWHLFWKGLALTFSGRDDLPMPC